MKVQRLYLLLKNTEDLFMIKNYEVNSFKVLSSEIMSLELINIIDLKLNKSFSLLSLF